MSTPYATIYTKLSQAGIPQETAHRAAADISILGESPRFDALQLTDAFITTHRANANTALDALEELVERVEAWS